MLYNPAIMDAAGTDQILQMLDDLCHVEASMAAYYLACSEKWGLKSSMWMQLAMEEERHEKILRDLIKVVEAYPDRFEPGLRIEPTAISSFVENITEMTADILRNKVELDAALSFALRIEESIIEGRFFEIIISRNRTYLKFMEAMSKDLVQHRQVLIDEMKNP